MLSGTVEPLLSMNSTNRFTSIITTNGDCNSSSSTSEISMKRSTTKTSSRLDVMFSTDSNADLSSMNTNNRIKFVDMLVCGSCQQDFQLSDIVKFIEHKAKCGNKENKHEIPYHYSQHRRHHRKNGHDDEYDDDDDDDNKSHQSGNSSESENENHSQERHQSDRQRLVKKHTTNSKVLVDASANTLNGTGISIHILFFFLQIYRYLLFS